jgi:hypothetical protein
MILDWIVRISGALSDIDGFNWIAGSPSPTKLIHSPSNQSLSGHN